MAWTFERTAIRVKLNGSAIAVAEDPTISEAAGNLSRTAEIRLASLPDPEPAESDVVTLELIDGDAGTVWTLFEGTINSIEVESDGGENDFALSVLAVDQLEKLRATNKSGDMDFAGMTDGDVWKAVADYCGVIYDDADIADTGFVVAQRAPLSWKDDASTAGASIIAELDDVFGMLTMTVGANRVIRIPVDYTPANDTGLYRTYTKTTDVDWSAHHRARGDRDAIQNVWRVTGASAESADGSCQSTPWAFAVSGNAQIGRRVRTAEQTFSSDFIQDKSLAESIVRRLMRRYNRLPDRATIALGIDANLHPGGKVKLVDHTYGIETGSGRRCYVDSVDRTGFQMAAELQCGPAGAEGTVSSGIDKVCGDAHSDPGWDDGYTDPPFDYPPVDAGDPIDYSDQWDTPPLGSWDMGAPVFSVCETPGDPASCTTAAFTTGASVEAGHDWAITGTVRLEDAGDGLKIGLSTDDGDYAIRIAGGGFYDPLVGQFRYEVLTPFGAHRLTGYAPLFVDVAYKLIYFDSAHSLEFYADVGDDACYSELIPVPLATMAGATTIRTVTGAPTRTGETLLHNCGAGGGGGGGGACMTPTLGDWSTISGTVGYASGEVDLTLDTSPTAHLDTADVPINAPTRTTITGSVAFSGAGTPGVDTPFFTAALFAGGFFAGMQITWDPDTGDGNLYATGFVSGFEDVPVPASYLAAGFDFSVTCDPATDTVTAVIGGGDYAAATTMDAWTDATVEISGAATSALTATVSGLSLCFFGASESDDLLGIVADWVEVNPTLTTHVGGAVETSANGSGYNSAHLIDPAASFTIAATLQMSGAGDVFFGVGTVGTTLKYGVNLLTAAGDVLYAYTANAYTYVGGTPFATDTDLSVSLLWSAEGSTLIARVSDGVTTVNAVVYDGGALPGFALYLMIGAEGGSSISVSALTMEIG